MANLVMVMPYRAYLIGARQEGFRVCAIWDPSLSSVMPTARETSRLTSPGSVTWPTTSC